MYVHYGGMQRQPVNLRLDRDLLDATDALADAMGIARTELIERGLRRELLHDGKREFVYVLVDPDRCVRYVGRSRDPHRRLREHIAAAKAGGATAKERWLADLLADNRRPCLVIIDDAEPGEAVRQLEAEWIEHFKAHDTLTNDVAGGVAHGLDLGGIKQIRVRVDDDLLARIERARGLVPREPWMRRALDKAAREQLEAALAAGDAKASGRVGSDD
jgi:Arc/MetJ family transcription regulator